MKVFWQGNKLAWKGLFKNFVCSFFYILQNYFLTADPAVSQKFWNDGQNKNVIINFRNFENLPINKTFNEIGKKFLKSNAVKQILNFYGGKNIK